jgi:hypothetical protein
MMPNLLHDILGSWKVIGGQKNNIIFKNDIFLSLTKGSYDKEIFHP